MATNQRTLKLKWTAYDGKVDGTLEIVQQTAVDFVTMEQRNATIGFPINDVPKICAALLELRTNVGYSIDDQVDEIKKVLKTWNKKKRKTYKIKKRV